MVHLDGLDFGGDVGGGEGDNHTSLDDTGLDSADGDCSDTSDLYRCISTGSKGSAAKGQIFSKTHCRHPGGEVGEACR